MKHLIYLVKLLIPLLSLTMTSCGDIIDDIECLEIGSVRATVDISLFKGFTDNSTMSKTIEKNGKPSKVFDSLEPTTIEGYNIHEYVFDDGDIDCYVSKESKTETVDYVYYEPKGNIPLSKVIKDKNVLENIKKSNANVIFLRDAMGQYLRLRLNRKDLSEVLNISLGDITQLEELSGINKAMDEFVSPSPISDFGMLTKLYTDANELHFCITVNETQETTIQDFCADGELADVLSSFMFNWFFPFISKDLIEKDLDVVFELSGKISKSTRTCRMKAENLRSFLYDRADNELILKNLVKFENFTLSHNVHEGLLTLGKRTIDENCLYIHNTIYPNNESDNVSAEEFKKYITSLFTDKDNPEIKYVSLCVKCEKDMEITYTDRKFGKVYKTRFSVEELGNLLNTIH